MCAGNLSKLFFCCSIVWLGSFSLGLANNQPISPLTTLLELQHSPSPYECAVMSAHAYQEGLQEGKAVLVKDRKTKHHLPDWKVLKTSQSNELSQAWQQLGLPYQEQAILYRNEAKKQLVLAYKGLELNDTIKAAPETDVKQFMDTQEKALTDLLTEALSIAQAQQYSLTVTGHSLGGWLAQLTTFMAQQLYPETHIKAIAFDSPGARPILEQLNAGPDTIQLNYLDITNYLSTPNFINASSPHVGTVYQVVFERFSRKLLVYNQQSHAVENFLRAFSPSTGTARQCAFVQQWPLILPINEKNAQDAKRSKSFDVIYNLLAVLQRCTQAKALSTHKDFFRFAKKALRYRDAPYQITKTASSDTTHTYTYKTKPFNPRYLHIRHVPQIARQFLIGIQRDAPTNVQIAAQHPLVHAIQAHRHKDFISIPIQQDVRLAVDQLISLTVKHPTLCAPATLLPHLVLATSSLLPPPAVSFFVGRKTLQKQLLRAFVSEKPLVIAPPITGPGGIGKSQLAIRVMAQQALLHHYEHIFWISAETPEKLQDAYLCMAEDLGLYVDKRNSQKVVQDVRLHLKNKHCLYVFDDAPSSEAIEGFLPLHRGHALITSRNSNRKYWPVAPVLVSPLDTSEAIELAQQYSYGKSVAELSALKKLLAQVPHYPLFLVQLFILLADEGIQPAMLLSDLERYEANAKEKKLMEWLAQDAHPQVHYDKEWSMLYIFKRSLARLVQEDKGPEAIQLLSKLSYLDPTEIPLGFALTLDGKDESVLRRRTRAALLLLEKYSLIQWDRETKNLYVHAETQLIVRGLYPQKSLVDLVDHLVQYTINTKQAFKDSSKWTTLLPHGRMLYARLNKVEQPQTTQKLSTYMVRASDLIYLFEEGVKWADLFEEGIAWAQRQLNIAQDYHNGRDHQDIAKALQNVGISYMHVGNLKAALKYHSQALAMQKSIQRNQGSDTDISDYYNKVGVILWKSGKYKEALPYFDKALEEKNRLSQDINNEDTALYLHHRGRVLDHLGRYHEALRAFETALDIRRRIHSSQEHVRLAAALNEVGTMFIKLKRSKQIPKECEESFSMYNRLLQGQENKWMTIALNNMGNAFSLLGKHTEALPYYRRAAIMSLRIHRKEHYLLTDHLKNLVNTLSKLADIALIQRTQQEILPLCIQYLGKDHELTKALLAVGNAP